MERTAVRTLLAIIAAGVVGTLANAAARAVAIGADQLSLALVPGLYGVATTLCLALPLLGLLLRGAWFWITAVIWLAGAASLLSKFVFGAPAPWPAVLAFNLVYAVAALITYWVMASQRRTRRA